MMNTATTRISTKLLELREHLLKASHRENDSFSGVFSRFFDLVCQPSVMSRSTRVQNPELKAILTASVQQVEPSASLRRLLIVELGQRGFYHGAFQVHERQGTFFWFEALNCGLCALVDRDFSTLTFRITSLPIHHHAPDELN